MTTILKPDPQEPEKKTALCKGRETLYGPFGSPKSPGHSRNTFFSPVSRFAEHMNTFPQTALPPNSQCEMGGNGQSYCLFGFVTIWVTFLMNRAWLVPGSTVMHLYSTTTWGSGSYLGGKDIHPERKKIAAQPRRPSLHGVDALGSVRLRIKRNAGHNEALLVFDGRNFIMQRGRE